MAGGAGKEMVAKVTTTWRLRVIVSNHLNRTGRKHLLCVKYKLRSPAPAGRDDIRKWDHINGGWIGRRPFSSIQSFSSV